MQHPVGFEIDPETGRAVLNDIGAVLFQNTAWIAFLHTLSASFLVSGAGVAGVSAWMIMKNRQADIFRPAAKLGAWVILVSAVLVSVTGDMDMKIMVDQQPMKVAAAEALYTTQENAPFSILSASATSPATRPRRSSRSPACCPTWPPAPGTAPRAPCRASTTCRRSTSSSSRSTAPR